MTYQLCRLQDVLIWSFCTPLLGILDFLPLQSKPALPTALNICMRLAYQIYPLYVLFTQNAKKDNEDHWRDISVGILIVTDDGPTTSDDLHLTSLSSSIILEGGIVLDDIKNLPQALLLVFGLIYALNLEYPKPMKNTLNFIQMVMLGLGANKLPPKLQALKNGLSY